MAAIIRENQDGDEERHVELEGHPFKLVHVRHAQEWQVYWLGEPPEGTHPAIGAVGYGYLPDSTRTTGLEVTNLHQIDWQQKEELLRRVVTAAGLEMRPRSSRAS